VVAQARRRRERHDGFMRAVVFEEFGGSVDVRTVDDPAPSPGGVVVEVHATGLCRSDWHAWAGHDDGVALPHIPGHELVGVIVAIGAEVRRWTVGERVTTPFVCGCGRCEWCQGGQAQVCPDQTQPGFTHWGSFAEYVALHAADTNLVAVADVVGDAAAAGLGCRFATAYRALNARARVRRGEWVTVVGVGGVGLSAVQIAVAAGARVIAVDRTEAALALARSLGAEHTLLAGQGERSDGGRHQGERSDGGRHRGERSDGGRHRGERSDVAAQVHDLTGGGSHVAVDAVGTPATCAAAIHSLRRRGRHVQVGLLPSVGGHPAVPMDRVIAWELDVLGSHGMASVDYPDMLRLVEEGTLRPQALVERVVGLAEGARLLPSVDAASPVGVTLIDPRLS
jgi:alcohol dehydrogenase